MDLNQNEINLSGAQSGGAPGSPTIFTSSKSSVLYSRFQPSTELPWIVKTLVKTKIVKSEKQAEKLLLILISMLVVAAIVFFFISFQEPEVKI